MKCVVNNKPMDRTTMISGVRSPYAGQKAMVRRSRDIAPRKAEMGMRRGQYISHGRVTLSTIGSLVQIVLCCINESLGILVQLTY